MAKTKRSSLDNLPTTTNSSKQVTYRIKWRQHRGGGQERYYEEEDLGEFELKIATEEDIKPNHKYYLVDPKRKNVFYETFFAPEVSWETIIEFVSTKKIYIKYAKPTKAASIPNTSKPPTSLSLWD